VAVVVAAVVAGPALPSHNERTASYRVRRIGGPGDGAAIVEDLSRGAEAYLQMWERAEGIQADPCRNPGLRRYVVGFTAAVTRGMTTREVLTAVGQPFTRLGSTFGYCARTGTASRVPMQVWFDNRGRVAAVRRAG
jgi:hypothetical protein